MFTGRYDHELRDGSLAPAVDGREVAQRKYEIETLCGILNQRYPKAILEIGTYQGGTLWHFSQTMAPDSLLISIDTCHFANPWNHDDMTTFIHINGNSHDDTVLRQVRDTMTAMNRNSLDFLFIDADHTEAGATQDFEMYGPLVRRGGLIAFHDIINPAPHRNQDHIRVSNLWKRIQRAGYLTREIIAHPDQEWGGIGVVYVE